MKVKDLIKYLKECDQNLEVYSFCDYGQTPEKADRPSEVWVGSLDHSVEDYTPYDDDAEELGYKLKAVML